MGAIFPLAFGLNSVKSCREQELPPVAKVMRKEAWHTQSRDQASGVSLEILEHQEIPVAFREQRGVLCFHSR